MAPKRPLALVIGAILMLALGLARGAGRAVLLVRGRATLPDIRADAAVLPVLACFLILIGAAEVAAAIGVLRLKRAFWRLGVAATAAFVVDGAVNGYVLFGKPGDAGTVVNVVVAALILTCLWRGRTAIADHGLNQHGEKDEKKPSFAERIRM